MEVGDVAIGIGEDRVVRRVCLELHGLPVGLVVARFGPRVRLRQGLDVFLHQADGDPFAVRLADDGPVGGAIDREFLLRHAVVGFVGDGNLGGLQRALFVAVLRVVTVALLRHGFEILIDGVDAAGGVHPAGAFVEALVDEELAPGYRAVGVQAFIARHLEFGAEEEGSVGIDEQQGVVGRRVGRGDGHAVRAGRLPFDRGERFEPGQLLRCALAVEGFELSEIHAFDIAADAALREAQGHPRLESFDDTRFHGGVLREVEVQAVGEGVHQGLEPWWAGGVLFAQVGGIDEELHAQILVDAGLAFGFGETAHGIEVVRLHAVKVVFRLGVHHAEHGIGIGFAVDMGDAVVVPHDGDTGGLFGPACGLRLTNWLLCSGRDQADERKRTESHVHGGRSVVSV